MTPEAKPVLGKLGKASLDLTIFGHVTGQHDVAAKISSEFFDSLFKAFANIGKGKLGTLLVAGFGNAVGNRPV